MLPCSKCREHFEIAIEHIDSANHPVFASRDALARFLVDTHNDVNRLGKTELTYNYIAQK